MRVKANNKIYDVLEYTNNKKEIEDFMGEDTVVQTRMRGVGFTADHDYAVDTLRDRVWLTPGTEFFGIRMVIHSGLIMMLITHYLERRLGNEICGTKRFR